MSKAQRESEADREALLDIEASLRLEGFDLRGDAIYQDHKAKILAGEMSPEEAKAETLVYFMDLADHRDSDDPC